MRRDDRDKLRQNGAAGFTLIELLVVIAIIGLIIALILVAAADGVRRAEERATQALITKLDTGLNDRLDALLNAQAPVNQTHRYLAAINFNPSGSTYIPVGSTNGSGSDERRAQVIAQFDYIRAELPDVFFINGNTSDGTAFASTYPLNFAGAAYPDNTGLPYTPYYLPLGNLAPGLPLDSSLNLVPNSSSSYTPPAVSGIFGASFSAAGGVYKNLYAAATVDLAITNPGSNVNSAFAYDGVDNNGNGMIDEIGEVKVISTGTGTSDFPTAVYNRLNKHTHKTARAEMLYAILVEGLGPLGSVFNRDDFTAREVQDTDGDGLPEFVDAWGEPLQFYRWPIYFGTVAGSSDSQIGSAQYNGFSQVRELDPLDPNQLLVSPGWWSTAGNPAFTTSSVFSPSFTAPNGAVPGVSQGALAFMHYFHLLYDPTPTPIPNSNPTSYAPGWDRSGNYARRAYFSKFLVLSCGSDKEPGVAGFGRDYTSSTTGGATQPFLFPNTSFPPPSPLTMDQATRALIYIENQASQSDPTSRTGSFFEVPGDGVNSTATTIYLQTNVGLDDISNHNIQAPGTGVR